MIKQRLLRLWVLILCAVLGMTATVRAQDGFNLSADLYVLLNDGRVERYGVGAAGVETVTPAESYVVDFGIDANGSRIAYRTETGLFLRDLAIGDAAPLELEGMTADLPPFRGAGATIAWAPPGDGIAYTTQYGARVFFSTGAAPVYVDLRESLFRRLEWSPQGRFLAAEDGNTPGIWWLYRREGFGLTLTSIITDGTDITWIGEGEIVFAPVNGGLRLMSLDRANQQIDLLDASLIYRLPALNAGDALVFFARDPADATVPPDYGILLQLERGAQQVETLGTVPVALNQLTWTPDASLLVAFQGGVLAFFSPIDGLGFPLPLNGAVMFGWGALRAPAENPIVPILPSPTPTILPTAAVSLLPTPLPVTETSALTLSSDGFFLAPGTNGVIQVWRLPANGTEPTPFTSNTADAIEFTPSPSGDAVAYVVDAELWLQIAGEDPFRLARLGSFAPAAPSFSADENQVAYTDEGSGIWRIAVAAARDGEDPELLRARTASDSEVTEQALRRPQFSPDGTKLLFDVYRADTIANFALDIESRQVAEGAPVAGGDLRPARARWLRDGRIYTILDATVPVDAPPGIYLIDPPQPNEGTLLVTLPPQTIVRAVVEPLPGLLRLLIAQGTTNGAPLQVIDIRLDEAPVTVTPIVDIGALSAPRLSADGRFVGGFADADDPNALLTVIDILTTGRFALSGTAGARSFVWAGGS